MKRITSLLVILFVTIALNAQTINQTTTWPDASWTLAGSYDTSNLLANPTTVASNFKFDDAQVAHTGDIIYIQSPVINLTSAFNALEKGLKISFSLAFALTPQTSELIGFQYWDADNSLWHLMPQGTPDSGDSMGAYTTCDLVPIDIYFDFSTFTTNQLQNFKYRLFYDDGGLSQGKGICMTAPTITSVSCNNAPTNLAVVNLSSNSVNIGWTANNGETQWQMEYGAAGYTVGSGIEQQWTDQNPNGFGNLSGATSYDAYVRGSCTTDNSGGELFTPWSSKLNFTTLVTCPDVSGFSAPDIASNSIRVAWTSIGNETWNVEVGLKGYIRGIDNPFFNVIANAPSTTMFGLSPNTAYDFYIQANCGNENFSNWAGPFTYTTLAAAPSIDWANLQWPASGAINLGANFTVYSQIYINGVTNSQGQASGVSAWIGYSTADTNPNTWTNWVEARYNTDNGNNDEYMANIGLVIPIDGNYYYASRFQYLQGDYSYGGFSLQGGNFWNGSNYVSGQLTINRTASQWSTQTSPLGSQVLGKVQFVSPAEGWITAGNGQLLHTVNAGSNWTIVDPDPSENIWTLSDPSGAMSWINPTHGWVISTLGIDFVNSTGAVLHYTTDGGTNWTRKVISNAANDIGVQVQFFDANNGWLAVFNSVSLVGSLYTSTDGGANWTFVSSGSDVGTLYFIDANIGWKVTSTNFNPPYTISHTTDGGVNWTPQYTDNTSGSYNAMFFIDANNGWAIGNDDKLLKTADGGTNWTPLNNTGLPVGGNNFKAIFFLNANVGWIGAGGEDNRNSSILRTDDGGTTWEIQPLAIPSSAKSNGGNASKTQGVNDTADIFSIFFTDELNGWYVADNGNITHTTGDPLSVQEVNNTIEGFSFYPNPAQNHLMLKSKQKINQVEVYNLLGQQLMVVKPNVSNYQLELNSLNAGLYFVKVKVADKTGTYKVVKQ